MKMTTEMKVKAEQKVDRLIEAIDAIIVDVEQLHNRIIDHGDRKAWQKLEDLAAMAKELYDEIYQQDFMNIERYANLAEERRNAMEELDLGKQEELK